MDITEKIEQCVKVSKEIKEGHFVEILDLIKSAHKMELSTEISTVDETVGCTLFLNLYQDVDEPDKLTQSISLKWISVDLTLYPANGENIDP